jgi:Fic family protein
VTMSEVLEIEAGGDGAEISQAKREDAEEIRNYRMALRTAAGMLDERPLSLHLLRGAHSLLMDGVRIGRESIPVMPRERNPILSANFESGSPHGLQDFCIAASSVWNSQLLPSELWNHICLPNDDFC